MRCASSPLSQNTIGPAQRGNEPRPPPSSPVHPGPTTSSALRFPTEACHLPRVTPLSRAAETPAATGNLAFRQRLSRSVDCRKLQRRATARGSLNEFPTRAILPCASLALPSLSFSHTLLTSYCLRFSSPYQLLSPVSCPTPTPPPRTSSALIPTQTRHAGHDAVRGPPRLYQRHARLCDRPAPAGLWSQYRRDRPLAPRRERDPCT